MEKVLSNAGLIICKLIAKLVTVISLHFSATAVNYLINVAEVKSAMKTARINYVGSMDVSTL